MENLTLCLTILITGFAVVFSVLILLIIIIKLYGTIVTKALNYADTRRARKAISSEKSAAPVAASAPTNPEPENNISHEPDTQIVAVIAAAVDSIYGADNVRITGIKKRKTSDSRPTWGMAGIFENTKPF